MTLGAGLSTLTSKMYQIFVASCDSHLSGAVKRLLPHANVVHIDFPATGVSATDRCLIEENAEILLSDVSLILDVAYKVKKLKWAASTWAGVEKLLNGIDPKKSPSFQITRMGGAFSNIMAEYVLGYIVTKERCIIDMAKDQEKCNWNKGAYMKYRSLTELTISILGVGEIGQQVARLCNAAGMRVIGINRTIPDDDRKCLAVSQYKTMANLPEVLQESDYVCNILPSTPLTQGLLNKEMFRNCEPKKSIFINIGRGTIASETDILTAMREGWLGGAILDVFMEEPLPKNSALWKCPGVTITPHVAGMSLTKQVAESFAKNYKLFTENKPLQFLVDLKKGY